MSAIAGAPAAPIVPVPSHPLNYCENLPNNIWLTAAQSFAVSFIVSSLIAGPLCGLCAGSISAVASIISSLVSPIFDWLLERCHPLLKMSVKVVFAISSLALLCNSLAPSINAALHIDYLISLATTGALNLVRFFKDDPNNSATTFMIIS